MKRRLTATLLLCILTFSLVATANAAETRVAIAPPTLSFTGTTANCKLSVTKFGSNINATLELWKGNTRVASWSGTATSSLIISKTKSVISGQTYTLKAHGTIDGVSFTAPSITKTCP